MNIIKEGLVIGVLIIYGLLVSGRSYYDIDNLLYNLFSVMGIIYSFAVYMYLGYETYGRLKNKKNN